MTDRRDPDEEELRELLADLESTLVELRGEYEEHREGPQIPRGLPGDGRRPPRPPRFRDVLRFTEEYTIPTLISVLEANIRLLRLGGAAIRALDPERSAVPGDSDRDSAVGQALDAGRGLSTDRLSSGLAELNDALAGTDAPDPAARELLSEAEELSTEIQQRLREARDGSGKRSENRSRRESFGGVDDTASADNAVHIDVQDGSATDIDGDADNKTTEKSDDEEHPAPNVDAELDSIREEVRGPEEGDDAEQLGDDEPDDTADKAE